MTRLGAAALNLPKSQYFDQIAFLHERKVLIGLLRQPSTLSPEALADKNQ